MTKRVTISVPDDVADVLEALPPAEATAHLTGAVRRLCAAGTMRASLADSGVRDESTITLAMALADAAAMRAEIHPALLEAAHLRLAELLGLPVEDVREAVRRGRL
ncbi:hypothetical protein Afil01_45650 [Actinorhabdospora filicis]|uniref:Uncharacterized protein n=1 Tax=Actinorhabdospora filicis TaxID=1785913 RepID=A0A9W6SP24_9ACTN|nr:hypothetical protein [Actinorhabdospora filicis]GLZ79758.1 hypothetical protein Afil01_45650 [Actinorhabdospora filicis]